MLFPSKLILLEKSNTMVLLRMIEANKTLRLMPQTHITKYFNCFRRVVSAGDLDRERMGVTVLEREEGLVSESEPGGSLPSISEARWNFLRLGLLTLCEPPLSKHVVHSLCHKYHVALSRVTVTVLRCPFSLFGV